MNKTFVKQDGYRAYVLLFGVQMLMQILGGFVLGLFENQSQTTKDVVFWVVNGALSISFALSAYLYCKMAKKDFVSCTTLNVEPKTDHVLWGFIVVLGLVAFMNPVNNAFIKLLEGWGATVPKVDIPRQIVPMVLVACIFPAFNEEIIFRGTIARAFCSGKNVTLGIVASGALFALFHLSPAQTLHQFVVGCAFALWCFRSGSVWTAVLMHLFNNLVVVATDLFVPMDWYLQYQWHIAGVGVVVFAVALTCYLTLTVDVNNVYNFGKNKMQHADSKQTAEDYQQQQVAKTNNQNKDKDVQTLAVFALVVLLGIIVWTTQLTVK